MCYICRQDVQQQGYQHFCQHFRPLGGACKNCNKCGLYDKEDEEQGNHPPFLWDVDGSYSGGEDESYAGVPYPSS
jgi:hypothetical protein